MVEDFKKDVDEKEKQRLNNTGVGGDDCERGTGVEEMRRVLDANEVLWAAFWA